jgi:hypothetical protein
MEEERQFSREDLLSAWLEWKRWGNAHVDLRTYYEARVRALSAAFGVELDELEEGPGRPAWIRRCHYELFRKTAEDYNRVHNPFSDYFEEGPEAQFSVPHAARICSAADGLREAYRHLLLDLMDAIWNLGPDHRVTAEALRDHGFDPSAPAPDPVDYW